MKAKWRSRVFFAEVAESLSIGTQDVFSSTAFERDEQEFYFVLYSPRPKELWSCWLRRGQDGVLVLNSEPKEESGLWEEIEGVISSWESESDGN